MAMKRKPITAPSSCIAKDQTNNPLDVDALYGTDLVY